MNTKDEKLLSLRENGSTTIFILMCCCRIIERSACALTRKFIGSGKLLLKVSPVDSALAFLAFQELGGNEAKVVSLGLKLAGEGNILYVR